MSNKKLILGYLWEMTEAAGKCKYILKLCTCKLYIGSWLGNC